MPAWTANIMDKTPVAGPAGYYYADLPNRIIAYIIDAIIIGIGGLIVAIISRTIFGVDLGFFGKVDTTTSYLVTAILSAALAAGYFIYTWTAMRASIGMRVLGMQIGDESDGHSINYMQGAYRYAFMWGPYYLAVLLVAFAPGIGVLTYLVALGWGIYLLYTTSISPTKQGLHDKFAKTMIVKAARAVA